MSYAYAPWHLRSFHHHHGHGSTGGSSGTNRTGAFNSVDTLRGSSRLPAPHANISPNSDHHPQQHDHHTESAIDLFCGHGDTRTNRTGIVDGQEVTFELLENVTKERPSTPREERQKSHVTAINVEKSSWDLQARWWLLQFGVPSLTVMYLVAYLALNFVFAGFWSIQEGTCCDDSELTYAQIFDFAIQTSTTIGYGGYVPSGHFSNFLVVVISIVTLILNSIYAGVLVLKFLSPSAKIKFSEVMTLSNVNGLPCLELRIGNCDGYCNLLLDANVRLTYSFLMEYVDEKGETRSMGQTEELKLLTDKRCYLDTVVWTLRHMIDEHSPLYGLDLYQPPGSHIFEFRVAIQVTQQATGAMVYQQTGYQIEDVMIGHRFVDQLVIDKESRTGTCDFAKFDTTLPAHVWYPVKRGVS